MKLLISILIGTIFVFFFLPSPSLAQSQPENTYYKAKVLSIVEEGEKNIAGRKNMYQNVRAQLLEGPDKNKTVSIEHGGTFTIDPQQKVSQGDTVIIASQQTPTGTRYAISDKYRLPIILYILVGFFLFVITLTGKKGAGAMLGMIVSLAVIIWFIIPQILRGSDPLLISILGSLFILFVTIFLAHGFHKKTMIAVVATFISLLLTALFAIFFVKLTHLTGLGSEDIYSLQQGFKDTINFQGLLLGGIIIGALGVLDDVTTTQSAAIAEIAEADPKITFQQLVKRGMTIGREHITSLVNTLVLAYAGASIGVFIFLILSMQNGLQPLWVTLNSEVIVEEVVRTLAGSMGLILAVPITTLLASFFAKNDIKIIS